MWKVLCCDTMHRDRLVVINESASSLVFFFVQQRITNQYHLPQNQNQHQVRRVYADKHCVICAKGKCRR